MAYRLSFTLSPTMPTLACKGREALDVSFPLHSNAPNAEAKDSRAYMYIVRYVTHHVPPSFSHVVFPQLRMTGSNPPLLLLSNTLISDEVVVIAFIELRSILFRVV